MGSKYGPVDPGLNGKASKKVEEAADIRNTARDNGPTSMNDDFDLTVSADLLERLEKSLSSLPTVDSIRVAEVKAAIESGEYESDSEVIADAMIRFEQSLDE